MVSGSGKLPSCRRVLDPDPALLPDQRLLKLGSCTDTLLCLPLTEDRVETTVIDEDLIKTAYEEERESLKNTEISDIKRDPMTMPEIIEEATTLRLSFRSEQPCRALPPQSPSSLVPRLFRYLPDRQPPRL